MIHLNVNTDAVVAFTNKLEKLNRSAFPVAVRTALNSAAFNMKKDTLLKSAADAFDERSPNFFKAFSRVEQAKGFDLASMRSTVGFTEQGLKGGKNFAVKDLEQQEEGGEIKGKSFIPKDQARVGRSYTRNVRPIHRLLNVKKIMNAEVGFGRNKKQRFIRAAIKAVELYGKNAFILGNRWGGGRQTLSRIDEIRFSSRYGKFPLEIKRTPIYTYKRGRHLNVKGKRFAKRAAFESGLRIEGYYIKEAQKQFVKYLK